jgi:purine-binding chemotaxis protein CheW
MDEHNPNTVPADPDYENYLSILQKMQNSLSDEESATAPPTFEAEISEDDFPLAPTLLTDENHTPSAVQEPEFDTLLAPTGELGSNGYQESVNMDWSAMPTQPLVLPDGYLNGSSFAAFDVPPETLGTEALQTNASVSSYLEDIAEEAPIIEEINGLAEVEPEMPTGFVLESVSEAVETPGEFVAPAEFETAFEDEQKTRKLDVDYLALAAEAFGNLAEETPEPEFDLSLEETDAPIAFDFELPSAMMLSGTDELPQPELKAETTAADEETFAPVFELPEEELAPALEVEEETVAPLMFAEAETAAEMEEPLFEELALPETNFLTDSKSDADFSFEALPEPSFMLGEAANDDVALEEPDFMMLSETAETAAPTTEIPLEIEDFDNGSDIFAAEMPLDFTLNEEADVLETPAPPQALRGIVLEEEELPQPNGFEEFPSFIDEDESAAITSQKTNEFPEDPKIILDNSADAPLSAGFQKLIPPAVLPNDFTQNGKHEVQTKPPVVEAKSAAEPAVKTHSTVESGNFLEDRYIVFKLENDLYGFPAASIKEIGHPLEVTPLPFVPAWFLGIANLRGDILTVLGLRELWGKPKAVNVQKPKMLVLHSIKQEVTVGLVVDQIREMRRVSAEEIRKEGASAVDEHLANYRVGEVDYEGQRLRLLDAEKFLQSLKG